MLDIIPDANYVIGAELGPYKTSFVVTDLRGKVISSAVERPTTGNYSEMLEFLGDNIRKVSRKSGIRDEKLLGAGVGVPGFIDREEGIIRGSFRPEWNGKALAADLSKILGTDVCIDNNVQARAMGEELFNRDISEDSFAYYFVSYGIACPLFVRNNMVSSITTGAGEVGHMVVEVGGAKCGTCGNNGCLEAVASENAIIQRAVKILQSDIPTILKQICDGKSKPDIDDILQAQQCDDMAVETIVQEAIGYLGINLANIINFMSPHVVFIDAAIFKNQKNRDLMMSIVKKNIFVLSDQETLLEFVEYDPLRGAKGGAATAIKRFLIEN